MAFTEHKQQMSNVLQREYEGLAEKLSMFGYFENHDLKEIQNCIALIESKILWLRDYLDTQALLRKEDEIYFFKEVKPKFYCLLIFYIKIYKIELRRPIAGKKIVKAYLQKELNYLNHYFETNQEFYQYLRSGETYLDEEYFTRKPIGEKIRCKLSIIDADRKFSTAYDFILSKIRAHEMLQEYLHTNIEKLKKKIKVGSGSQNTVSKLNWTASLAALNELIYGLKAVGAINNGNVTVSEIAECFEQMFQKKSRQHL